MRIIVEAFKESLETGLAKNGQIVVRISLPLLALFRVCDPRALTPVLGESNGVLFRVTRNDRNGLPPEGMRPCML